jgi:hypothetical protein
VLVQDPDSVELIEVHAMLFQLGNAAKGCRNRHAGHICMCEQNSSSRLLKKKFAEKISLRLSALISSLELFGLESLSSRTLPTEEKLTKHFSSS